MDEKELKEYIESVEKRLTVTINSTEKRISKAIDNLDFCIKDLKKRIADIKEMQLDCQGLKDVASLKMKLDDHIEKHKSGFSRLTVCLFIFFAFAAMIVGILTLILHMSRDM